MEEGALLKAVLKYEFWDDDFDFKHLSEHIPDPSEGNVALQLDTWYSENVERLHEVFELLSDVRPAMLSDCVVVSKVALLEICLPLTVEAQELMDDPELHLEPSTNLLEVEEETDLDGEGDE
jgi:hypothetical protein